GLYRFLYLPASAGEARGARLPRQLYFFSRRRVQAARRSAASVRQLSPQPAKYADRPAHSGDVRCGAAPHPPHRRNRNKKSAPLIWYYSPHEREPDGRTAAEEMLHGYG